MHYFIGIISCFSVLEFHGDFSKPRFTIQTAIDTISDKYPNHMNILVIDELMPYGWGASDNWSRFGKNLVKRNNINYMIGMHPQGIGFKPTFHELKFRRNYLQLERFGVILFQKLQCKPWHTIFCKTLFTQKLHH